MGACCGKKDSDKKSKGKKGGGSAKDKDKNKDKDKDKGDKDGKDDNKEGAGAEGGPRPDSPNQFMELGADGVPIIPADNLGTGSGMSDASDDNLSMNESTGTQG